MPECDELVLGRVELPSEDPAEDLLGSAEPFPCAAPIPDPPEWGELVPGRVEGLNQEIVVSGEGRTTTI